jgi:hypothetical protein
VASGTRIAAARIASIAMMAAIVVLVVARSTLVRWLAIAAIGLNLLIAVGYVLHLYRQREAKRA